MAKQIIQLGSTQDDGTGSTLRAGGDIINDNFSEIYTKLGDGTTLSSDTFTLNTGSQTLTNKSIDSDNNTITNIVNADIKSAAAIDASKIANGNVSSTEFQYLDGVTSAIQTQINTALATSDVAAASIGTSNNTNGYIRFSNNLLINWVRKSSTGTQTINWALAFTNFYGCYVAGESTNNGYLRIHSAGVGSVTVGNANQNITGWVLAFGRKT